jgi:hypothetical protein
MKTLTETTAMRNFIVSALFLFLTALDAQAQPTPAAPAPANVVPVSVGTTGFINRLYVSVTICAPGSTTDCRTIDNVLVSTVSTGLRVFASALAPSLALPQYTSDNGTPLGECISFSEGALWGPLKTADVQLGGERANSIPIEIISDPQFPQAPQGCSTTDVPLLNTPAALAGNGILGIGPFLWDCGAGCAGASNFAQWYYGCSASGCQPTAMAVGMQLPNPVALFANDHNGVVITLPPVPPGGGAPTVAGSLTFGIGTQANNALGNATILSLRPNGSFTTVYKGQPYDGSVIDSHALGLYFFDGDIPVCPSDPALYCPASTLTLSASLQGTKGPPKTADFRVANGIALNNQNPSFGALDGIAGPNANHALFTWGLPFFFGRSVFTGIEAPAGAGPYYAF